MIKNLYAAKKANYYDETENLNPDDIYDSLKKTSDEIQKYSFSSNAENLITNNVNNSPNYSNGNEFPMSAQKLNSKKFDALSSASLDSGISQIDGIKNLNNLNNTPVSSNESTPITHKSASKIPTSYSHNDYHQTASSTPMNGHSNDIFKCDFNTKDLETLHQNLLELIQTVQDSSRDEVLTKCSEIYKCLLTRLSHERCNSIKVLLLRAIGQIVNKCPFEEHMKLTFLTLMDTSKDADKDVVKTSEDTANYALCRYDAVKYFDLSKPFINHRDIALNITAISMLTKVCYYTFTSFFSLSLIIWLHNSWWNITNKIQSKVFFRK